MTIPYNLDIPDAPNNPSNDQPLMKENTNSIDTLIGVDHIAFNAANGGYHEQVHFDNFHPQSAPSNPISILYTDQGVVDTVRPQLYWRNSLNPYPVSETKAFGLFTMSTTPSFTTQFNCSSVTYSGVPSDRFIVTLNSNVVSGNNPLIFLQSNVAQSFEYTFAAGVLTIIPGVFSGAAVVNFLIIQM